MIDIDLDEILAGADVPASGAEDDAEGERPTKARDADAHGDADGSSDDRERTGADRKRLRQLQRTNSRLSRETENLRAELSEVRQYVESLARLEGQRASGSVAAAVEAAEQELQRAIDDGDSKAVVEALRKRDQAKERLSRFQTSNAEPSPRPQQSADPHELPHVKAWMDRNDWFDPELGDPDSKKVNEISSALVLRGLTLDDPRHLAEVERQMRAYKPQLFDDAGGDEPDVPRTAGSGRTVVTGASNGDGRKLPLPSAAERRVAEMAGLDLSDPVQFKRWQKNRAETLQKRGKL